MKNVLFLDVDGVLNNPEDLEKNSYDFICKDKVERVKKIIKHFDCYVVLSSTWRLDDHDSKLVSNFIEFQEKTPDLSMDFTESADAMMYGWSDFGSCRVRRSEIIQWINDSKINVNKAIVLDDLKIGLPMIQPVPINGDAGITDKDVEDIIRIFT